MPTQKVGWRIPQFRLLGELTIRIRNVLSFQRRNRDRAPFPFGTTQGLRRKMNKLPVIARGASLCIKFMK
jgi:hypothetical protein